MRYKRFNEKLGLCACASRRESVRVKAGLPSAACSCRPERNSLIRSSVHCGNHPQCSVKSQRSGFLKKIIFLIFWSPKSQFFGVLGAPNDFFWTSMPILTSKNMVWGVILQIILDLSFGFWSYFLAKRAIKI